MNGKSDMVDKNREMDKYYKYTGTLHRIEISYLKYVMHCTAYSKVVETDAVYTVHFFIMQTFYFVNLYVS